MKKEEKPKVIQPSEIIIRDKIKQREKIRREFLQEQKEKHKKTAKFNKKEIIAQLKEVYADAG